MTTNMDNSPATNLQFTFLAGGSQSGLRVFHVGRAAPSCPATAAPEKPGCAGCTAQAAVPTRASDQKEPSYTSSLHHGQLTRPSSGHSQAARAQKAVADYLAASGHPHLHCRRSRKCRRAGLAAGMHRIPDFFLQPAAVEALPIGTKAMRTHARTAREI